MSEEIVNEVMDDNTEEVVEESSESEGIESSGPETTEKLQEEINEAVENGASKEEVRQMIEEFHLKVNGKDFVRKVDLNDKEALKRELQMAMAGRQALEESANLKKLYNTEIERLKSDPFAVLKELGLNPEDIAYDYLSKKVEEEKKDPLELERERMQKELEAAYKKLEEREKEAQSAEEQRLIQEANISLENEILEALDEDPELPRSPRVIAEIGKTMMWAIKEQGFSDVKVKDVIPTVKHKLQREISDILNSLPDNLFEQYVSKNRLDKYREQRLSEIKKAPKPAPIQSKVRNSGEKKEQPKAKKRLSLEEFLRS